MQLRWPLDGPAAHVLLNPLADHLRYRMRCYPGFEYGGCYSWLLLVVIFLSIRLLVIMLVWFRLQVHKGVLAA